MEKFFTVLAVLLIAITASSSTITLKNGKIIEGTIVNQTADEVKIDLGIGVSITYYMDEIESIEVVKALAPVSESDEKYQQAQNYFQNQEFEKGLELVLELLEKNPNNAVFHNRAGTIYSFLNGREKAIYHFDKAIELDKDNAIYYMSRSFATDDFSEQESWLMKALEKDPQDDATHAVMMSMYVAEAISKEAEYNYPKALDSIEKGIAIIENYTNFIKESPEKKSPIIVSILPKLEQRLIDAKKMEARLKKDDRYRNLLRDGNQLMDKGKLQEAIEKFTVVINNSDRFVDYGYSNRSRAYGKLGDYDNALSDVNNAIEISEKYPAFRVRRGIIHRERGENQKALDDFNVAITMDSEYGDAYLGRSYIYKLLGDSKASEIDYNRAKELGASSK